MNKKTKTNNMKRFTFILALIALTSCASKQTDAEKLERINEVNFKGWACEKCDVKTVDILFHKKYGNCSNN